MDQHLQTRTLNDKPLYLVIVDDIIQKIRDGHFVAGDQLGSLGDFCTHYDVSMATAHRSIGELAKMGVIKTIPRKGAFVVGVPAPPAVEESAKVQRIILVEALSQRRERRSATALPGFTDPAVDAILRTCRQEQIPTEFQFIPVDATARHRVFFTPRTGDAIIAVGCGVSLALLSHLETPNVPSVLIDAAAHNVHCVLTDNYSGMHQAVSHLHQQGHRRIVMAVCMAARSFNTVNENERRDALLHHAGLLGMEVTVAGADDWDKLFKAINQGSTAVIFTRDDPAHRFIDMAHDRGMVVPRDVSVVGFDGWSQHSNPRVSLTTVQVDTTRMGQVAVEMVLDPPAVRDPIYFWHRVKPTLIVGDSTGRPTFTTRGKRLRD